MTFVADVLILPRRVVPRISDLTVDEASDLFVAVHTVSKTLEKVYKASALTIGLQVCRPDGASSAADSAGWCRCGTVCAPRSLPHHSSTQSRLRR